MAGVLVESSFARGKADFVVVGIGLNVHTRVFPLEIEAVATSLALARDASGARETLAHLDRGAILADVLAALDRDLVHVAGRGLGIVHARLANVDALRGQRIETDAASGVADGIDLDGNLIVRKDDGSVARVLSGEVHLAR